MIPFDIKRLLSTVIVLTVVCTCIAACRNAKQPDSQLPELPYSQMRTADLIFRVGVGVYSTMLNMQRDSIHYSHIGLLVELDSSWYVVHAVPKELESPDDFERVKLEKLEDFLAKERCLHAEFVHSPLRRTDRVVARALQYARDSVRFDNKFDLNDSTELYCTEMIWRLFMMEGIDLSEGRRSYTILPSLKGEGCITPEDMLVYPGNESYYIF